MVPGELHHLPAGQVGEDLLLELLRLPLELDELVARSRRLRPWRAASARRSSSRARGAASRTRARSGSWDGRFSIRGRRSKRRHAWPGGREQDGQLGGVKRLRNRRMGRRERYREELGPRGWPRWSGPSQSRCRAGAWAHPGHGEEIPWCATNDPAAPRETQGDSAVRLARAVLERGNPAYAVRMIAREAANSAEAALVLAEALDELGDPEGATLARARSSSLPP